MKLKSVLAAAALAAATSVHAVSMTNVAIGGTASQSTTDYGGPAERAIDGNTSGDWGTGSVSHTAYESNAWWQVALAGSHNVGSIVVFNRTDCCAERLSPFTVTLFNGAAAAWSSSGNQFVADVTGPAIAGMTFALPGVVGDRVRVTLDSANWLHLAEVQVMAAPVPEPTTWALALAGLGVVGTAARRRQRG